jgi:hypothetical protein
MIFPVGLKKQQKSDGYKKCTIFTLAYTKLKASAANFLLYSGHFYEGLRTF